MNSVQSNRDNGAAAMISEQDVLKVLQSVSGPDGKTPLPQTGAIAGLSVKDGKVYLSIAVDPAQAAAMEACALAAEKAVRGLPASPPPSSASRRKKPPGAGRRRGLAAAGAAQHRHSRRRPHHRGRLRQRRRRQIDDDGQSRAGACRARLAHRHSRSRHFRPVAAAPARHQRTARSRKAA